ncbi:MAG: hypothetical protein IH623_31805 [Verrucomicrobia bacterium]|nr:hypothetical protein [Verrucomicrobiota bacterium]
MAAFQHQARAQVGASNPALAGQFIQAAQATIEALICDCAGGKSRGQVRKIERREDGRVRMEFSAPVGLIYLIETSTNFVDCEKIGLAKVCGPGEFEFVEESAARPPVRFYRIVIP